MRWLTLGVLALAACHRAPTPRLPAAAPVGAGLSVLAGQIGGAGSIDGVGGEARFQFPGGLVWDGAFSLYIADTANDVIRRLDLASGRTETLAGLSGVPGSADGSRALSRLNSPLGLALDGQGHLFIADAGNAALRKLDLASLQLTTPIGSGSGVLTPSGLAFAAGQVFIADPQAQVVWAFTPKTRALTVAAGRPRFPGESEGLRDHVALVEPHALASDGRGQLYLLDGQALRCLSLASGQITTLPLAPSGVKQPRGLAADGSGALYLTDALQETLWRVDPATRLLRLVAGKPGVPGGRDGASAAAEFRGPTAVAAGGPGRLFLADASTLRAIDLLGAGAGGPTESLTRTLAGAPPGVGSSDGQGAAAAFHAPRGLWLHKSQLFVADTLNAVIRVVSIDTGAVTTLAGTPGRLGATDGLGRLARFERPLGLVADDTHLYVADPWSHTIRKVEIATGEVSTLAGDGRGVARDGQGLRAGFCGPVALALDAAGHLFVADRPYESEAEEESEGESGGDADPDDPRDPARDRTGCAALREIDLASGIVTTLAGSATARAERDGLGGAARFEGPTGVALDGHSLYVADRGGRTLRRLDLATHEVTTLAGKAGAQGSEDGVGSAARFDSPEGLAFEGHGRLLVTEADGATVRRVALANAQVSTVAGRHGERGVRVGSDPRLNQPTGVAAGEGRIFLTDSVENAVLQLPSQ